LKEHFSFYLVLVFQKDLVLVLVTKISLVAMRVLCRRLVRKKLNDGS